MRFSRSVGAGLSFILVFALCFSALSQGTPPVAALDKPNLYIDFLGVKDDTDYGPGVSDDNPANNKIVEDRDEGRILWIGVAIDNLNEFAYKNDGFYGVEIGVEYDPSALVPYSHLSAIDLGSDGAGSFEAWMRTVNKYNFANGVGTNNDNLWDSSSHEIYMDYAKFDEDLDPEVNPPSPSDYKMVRLTILKKDGLDATTNRFVGASDSRKKYILKIPFKILDDSKVYANGEYAVKLGLGPNTFSISCGDDGDSPSATWPRREQIDDSILDFAGKETNLNKLVNFMGDIDIFGGADADGITDIKVYEVDADADDTNDVEKTLYHDNVLTPGTVGFDPITDTYYVSVANGVESVKLSIASGLEPTVTSGVATPVTVTPSTGGYITGPITLVLPDTLVESKGFNNTITVTDGTSTYTIKVRRLGVAKIDLAYGNSPYGMIMRDSVTFEGGTPAATASNKAAAKAAFLRQDGDSGASAGEKSHTFKSGFVPQGGSTAFRYSPLAWGANENMDLNETAIFVYNRSNFKDPGFTAVDSLGVAVPDGSITRSIMVNRMLAAGTSGMLNANVSDPTNTLDPDYATSNLTFPGVANKYEFTTITDTNVSSKFVRVGVYDLKYTFTDPHTGAVVTSTRKVIVLFSLGDCDMDSSIGALDKNLITSKMKGTNVTAGITQSIADLYTYRIFDVDLDENIGALDKNKIAAVMKGTPIQNLYLSLN